VVHPRLAPLISQAVRTARQFRPTVRRAWPRRPSRPRRRSCGPAAPSDRQPPPAPRSMPAPGPEREHLVRAPVREPEPSVVPARRRLAKHDSFHQDVSCAWPGSGTSGSSRSRLWPAAMVAGPHRLARAAASGLAAAAMAGYVLPGPCPGASSATTPMSATGAARWTSRRSAHSSRPPVPRVR
jgi:hypothetical protein